MFHNFYNNLNIENCDLLSDDFNSSEDRINEMKMIKTFFNKNYLKKEQLCSFSDLKTNI